MTPLKISVGTDIESIERFAGKTIENNEKFLKHIFTQNELNYCFSKGCPEQHLCARFCAKEAVIKALSDFNKKETAMTEIEIFNQEGGAPYVVVKNENNITIKLSMSHTNSFATATAIAYK